MSGMKNLWADDDDGDGISFLEYIQLNLATYPVVSRDFVGGSSSCGLWIM